MLRACGFHWIIKNSNIIEEDMKSILEKLSNLCLQENNRFGKVYHVMNKMGGKITKTEVRRYLSQKLMFCNFPLELIIQL